MAEKLLITGTSATAKTRNPVGIVALTFITLGFYYFFWYYFVNREMRDLGLSRGTAECGESPETSLLAITIGPLIIVPPFVSHYKSFERMNAASRLTGAGRGFNAAFGLLLWFFFFPAALIVFQINLNRVWRAQRDAVAAAPAAALETPPQAATSAAESAVPAQPAVPAQSAAPAESAAPTESAAPAEPAGDEAQS